MCMRLLALLLTGLAGLIAASQRAEADFITTGCPGNEWTLNGSAACLRDRLRIAPAAYYVRGSAWYAERQRVVDPFRVTFQFQISDTGGIDGLSSIGGDGFAFVIQNSSPAALGDYGSGLGYAGADGRDSIPNSLALEFDLWRNTDLGDPNANHMGVHTRGTLRNSADEGASLASTTALANLETGVHSVVIDYRPNLMEIYFDDPTTPALVVPVNLDAALSLSRGIAWVGFTASTYNAWANFDIYSASFTTVPEPSTTGMLTVAAAALANVSLLTHRMRPAVR